MLLIACSTITTVSAESLDNDQKKTKVDTTPYNVKALFYEIISNFGNTSDQFYYVYKNPETNQIESSVKITNFSSSLTMQGVRLHIPGIAENFTKDEPKSYQMLHLAPGSNEMFTLKVVNENGQGNSQYRIRTKPEQEMWLMCCKNPQNPKLRDAYAITWVLSDNKSKATGTIYQITSLRPDMYEKSMVSNTFKIDGRVGSDLNDSLYVVYMADTAEELNEIADDAFVATMPVVNKRFNFSVEIDKPKVGRIRTVMPDGSLCKLWTNLDFVPGETYRITTHNGYYDEDRDYEQRVGRYSGKSLLNDLQRRGIDDQTVQVTDQVPEEFRVVKTAPNKSWRQTLPKNQQAQLQLKAELVEMDMEQIKFKYKTIGEVISSFRSRGRITLLFEQILKHNKELDKKFQDVIKLAKKLNCPAEEMPNIYKEIIEFYTEQNQALNEFYKDSITNGSTMHKLREYIAKQTEKYIKELEKSI
jgi:hypothetical protein